jgi:predicted glycosyltransferase involved in capsule biosynthesis
MNVSFLIAVCVDSEDRISNLKISTEYLKYHFPNSEIIVSELDKISKLNGHISNCNHIFTKTNDFFNKQKAYNIAARKSKNNILALYDADVVLGKNAILKSTELIEKNEADIVWPYDGRFYDVPKKYHNIIKESNSIKNINISECELFSDRSVGGAVFFKKNVFLEGGGGNENFKGVGWEDNEIYERFRILEYKIVRLGTFLLHLNHERKETSYNYNPFGQHNQMEFSRIVRKNKKQMIEEISKWGWIKNVES